MSSIPLNRKRPSPATGGWLPTDPSDRIRWLENLLKDRDEKEKQRSNGGFQVAKPLKKSLQELKDLIEDSAELSILFRYMFEEIPYGQRVDQTGEPYKITNYEKLLELFNDQLEQPPKFSEDMVAACPLTLLLEWPMATHSGLAAFLNEKLNIKLRDVLNEWAAYLADPNKDSKSVVVNEPYAPDSWLSKAARQAMIDRAPDDRPFEKVFKCTPGDLHLGFKSWDHFFTREFQDGVRPVEDTSDNTITSGCESAPYAIKQRVGVTEKFWLKGQPYSLKHMLQSIEDAKKFNGGTVYQAFLAPPTYHRWHSPINGTITKLRLIEGSYFSITPVNGFPDPEINANEQSAAYITSVATRAIFYLNNSTVGDMVMMPVGMVEISTCEFSAHILDQMDKDPKDPSGHTYIPKPNTTVSVKKGEEIGMFHYGGSTYCLIFGPDVHLKFWKRAIPSDSDKDYFVPLNAVIADVVPTSKIDSLYPDY